MATNLVRENRTADEIKNEIKLTLSARQGNPVFIIVEGKDDVDFFKDLTAEEVILYKSPAGKPDVYRIVESFSEASVIGVCDRDYDEQSPPEKIFLYDYSCLEVMLVSNGNVCSNVFRVLHIPSATTLLSLMKQLRWLSCLRKLNCLHEWGMRFSGLSISNVFVDLVFDKDKLIASLRQQNNNDALVDDSCSAIIAFQENKICNEADLAGITQGHDLIQLIQCYHAHYAKKNKRNPLKIDAIKTSIYTAYFAAKAFESSALFGHIGTYEQKHSLAFLKR
ncbi:MAG: DUF4435 domain-containing protein [Oscillospiraceae bacterium]|nr:DUF4435 domain-containing protein [Oscillospiraceae bacterium]